MKGSKRVYIVFAMLAFILFATAPLATAAVDKVRCILWQGDTAKQHTAISGQAAQLMAVITTTNTAQIWYKWVYGDGTESSVSTLSGATKYNVSITHSYTGAIGTPFTAVLMVDAVDNSMSNAVTDSYLVKLEEDNLDSKVNIAIDKGLWYLYTTTSSSSYFHTFDNSPFIVLYNGASNTGNHFASSTASAVHAFAINNHKVNGDFNQDPYAEAVKLGMNWLIQGYYYNSSYPMLQA